MNAKKAAAMIAIRADPKGLDRDLANAKKSLRGFGSDVKKVSGKLFGGAAGALRSLGAGLGMSAGFGLAAMVEDTMSFQKGLVRLQVAAGKSSDEMGALRSSITRTSAATAVAREEVLAGAHAYLAATGDTKGLADMMALLAKTAQATGAKTSDLAQVTAKLRDNFKIDNVVDMESALSSLVQQGKAGSVELSDLASTLASVAPQFAAFGSVGGVAGVGELGAAMQVVAKGFGTAQEAATGLRSMMAGLQQNADRFEKAGVRIYDKDPKTGEKRMRNFSEVWHDINKSKLVKDPTLLGKAFGQQEAKRAYDQLQKNAGLYDELIAAGQDYGAVNRDFGTVMADPAMRAEQAMNDLKIAIAEAFTPERIKLFADAVMTVVKTIADTIKGVSDLWDEITGKNDWQKNPNATQSVDINQGSLLEVGVADTFFGGGEQAAAGLINNNSALKARAAIAGPYGQSARDELANERSDALTVARIRDAGSIEAKKKAAVSALYGTGEGAAGGAAAAGRYIKSSGISGAEVAKIKAEIDEVRLAQAIAHELQHAPIIVKMDGSAVAKTVGNAPAANRGGG